MAANIRDVKTYSPDSDDLFFFDNNIWMYLFAFIGDYNSYKQKLYSGLLKRIRNRGCTIYTSSMIISEFTNRCFRMDFDLWRAGDTELQFKKDYVGTSRYKETAEEIRDATDRILSIADPISDEFESIELDNVFERMAEIDFNDSYYIELATQQDLVIVTDDQDFVNFDHYDCMVVTFINS